MAAQRLRHQLVEPVAP
ncbi:hypothetical protein ACE1BG_02610 [Aeromonas veronii]